MTEIDRIKAQLRAKKEIVSARKGLSTGCTLLNLALSGKPSWGLLPGHYYMLVGDSQAGKTWLALQIMAEAANHKAFQDYRLIHDNAERGALMDYGRFFGSKMARHIHPPKHHGCSRTIEEFYDNVSDALDQGDPFLYVLDSEDALTSEDELKKAKENKKARRGSKQEDDGELKVKGSYGDGKAKKNSSGLRVAHAGLEAAGHSILIVIKQTRDNIGFGAQFNPKTRSGGRALTFYASAEIWFSVKGKVKKNVLGRSRVVGSILQMHVKKNRIAGRDRVVEVPFYPSAGLDDLGSMVDYLVLEKHWQGSENKVAAPEFGFSGAKENLIAKIEQQGREKELQAVVAAVWQKIDQLCSIQRKPRYS